MTHEAHDPGGKVRTRLPEGMIGAAGFSECGRYRYWLSRQWGPDERSVLFVGLKRGPYIAMCRVGFRDEIQASGNRSRSNRWGTSI